MKKTGPQKGSLWLFNWHIFSIFTNLGLSRSLQPTCQAK